MGKRRAVSYFLLCTFCLLFAAILFAQNTPQKPLIVNGKQIGSAVQMDGRSYVDVETLAQATNGSVTIEPNRVILNLPPAEAGGQQGAEENQTQQPAQQQGLSRDFGHQAIAVLAGMREWRGAIGTILMYNVPVVGTWPEDYRDRVRLSLDQLRLSVMTDDDNLAIDLVENEFQNIANWADDVVSTRRSLNATNTSRATNIQEDTELAKITTCGRFLSSMLVSGSFSDDPSCH